MPCEPMLSQPRRFYVSEFREHGHETQRRNNPTPGCYDLVVDKYSWLARHEGLAPGRIINDLTLGTSPGANARGTRIVVLHALYASFPRRRSVPRSVSE